MTKLEALVQITTKFIEVVFQPLMLVIALVAFIIIFGLMSAEDLTQYGERIIGAWKQ